MHQSTSEDCQKLPFSECDFVEIDNPPYSLDLAPCDYFAFPNLKKTLRGTKLRDDDELKVAVERHFADKRIEYFYNGLKMLLKGCNPRIQMQEAYIEKYILLLF
jgi:hypothetical protein